MMASEPELLTINLRKQMESLLSQDNIPVEELEALAQRYHKHMVNTQSTDISTVGYADFLQKNLDWLNAFIDKLTAEKLAVATELTKIQKGRKAKQGYSENN
ncbi:hypothetical protein E0Z06_10380 [Rheinheimera sp. D18]|uniref:hypothetical protein n=1 Tax=Rheinheimera sp. D18 TaxID=2545632 RepID=UPI0010513862|nr:hypothetical protein [Rheinheimera sp. D18]QBL09902.1 hypothetical protein E0Z06_10380 [Rheinheimera sp. D18]